MRTWVALLLVYASMPLVAAAPGTGSFTLLGPIELQAPSFHTARVEAAYCPDTSAAQAFSARAARLSVDSYDASYVTVDLPTGRTSTRTALVHATYTLTNVSLALAPGDAKGWMGLDLSSDGILTTELTDASTVSTSAPGHIGNARSPPAAGARMYGHDVTHPFLALATQDGFGYAGAATIKIDGLDLQIDAEENSTTLETGELPSEAPMTTRAKWAILTFDSGGIDAQIDSPCQIAANSDTVTWNGPAQFTPTEGELRAGTSAYAATGVAVRIEGDLAATLTPIDAATQSVTLRGDVSSTTLAATTAPVPGVRGPSVLWILGLAALALTTVGSVHLLLRERKKRHAGLSADQLAKLADDAVNAEHYEEALDWLRLARDLAPTSDRIKLDEGYVLERLGHTAEALALYQEVGGRSEDGEPDVLSARLLHELGRDEAAADALVRALSKTPILLLDLEFDEELGDLLAQPTVAKAVREARRRLAE